MAETQGGTVMLAYRSPKNQDAPDVESVLQFAMQQGEDVAALAQRMTDDLKWATTNAVMQDAVELDRLDKIPSHADPVRDPFTFYEHSREAGLIARAQGAARVLANIIRQLQELREVPLSERADEQPF